MEWNSFVCFTVDKENGREPVKQQRKGIRRSRNGYRPVNMHCNTMYLCMFYVVKFSLSWIIKDHAKI